MTAHLQPNAILHGPLFPKPVLVALPMGEAVKLIGKGVRSGQVYETG